MFHQCDKMCLLTFIIFVVTESFSINTTAQLIPTYAKVAHWGNGKTSENEGRSRAQNLWTHSSEANFRAIPNKQKESTRYHYSMEVPSSKLDYSTLDEIPSKGEVQERFHPPPYFDFVYNDNPNAKKPNQNKPDISRPQPKPPSIVYASPINSKPPSDSYSSPFTSYNPPQLNTNNFQNTPPELVFPPYNKPNSNLPINKPPAPPKEIYQVPPNLSSYEIPKDKPIPDMQKLLPDGNQYPDSFHPPLIAPEYDKRPIFMPPPSEDGDAPMEDQKEDEKNEHDDLPPPEDASYLEHPPPEYDYHYHHSPKPPSMAEQDLSPPPSGIQFLKIPQYLDHKPDEHDFYHFNHHDVYHEETTATSTTTAAPRAGHYSYYYLGRKLWYIPLYFSVYFIIYVTILILKSIARHKIQFTHNFDKSRSFSELDGDYVNSTVVDAIENVNNKFM